MRLRLAHQLALLQAGTVAIALLAVSALVSWNLRSGFDDYLREQDRERLDQFAHFAGRQVEQRGLASLQGPPGMLRELVEATLEARGEHPMLPAPPPEAAPDDPPDPARTGGVRPTPRDAPTPVPAHGGDDRPPPPREAPPPDPAAFGPRLSITDADGAALTGRVPRPGEPQLVQAIQAHGATVAWAHLHERPAAAHSVEARFLARQSLDLAGVAAGSLVLALLAAWLTARRWVRPIAEAQAATRRISEGAFDVRLTRRGADEWGELADDVNRMAAALQQLEASRRRWIAELSHELRTPLAVLRAEIESLRDGIRPLDRGALASLEAEVRRLTRLTDDFHELALSDLRALPVAPEAIDGAALLRGVVERFRARAQSAGLALELVEPTALAGARVSWDAQRIEQLLSTLLENSLRYTDAPGRVVLACAGRGEELEITVDDSAPGVPEAQFDRLFDPLFRADASRSRHSGGSGLGLAIARAIAASHGGRIAARRSALGGLGISVTLPRIAVAQARAR